ncbi:MAG: hypothetical protein K6B44_02555 [Lachnospiraceae bacterium]|nr:hypothetical protein [Lachnospiraceae bacterium]
MENTGSFTITPADHGDEAVAASGQIGVETYVDFSGYLEENGTPGNIVVTSGEDKLESWAVENNFLVFKFKDSAAENDVAELSIPVTGSRNYNNYNLVVTLTADHRHILEKHDAKAATCSAEGNIEYYVWTKDGCGKFFRDDAGVYPVPDGDIKTAVNPDGHDWDGGTVTTEPGCEKTGERTYHCKHNEAHTKTEVIAALGHSFGEWEVTKEATEKEAGEKSRTCERCGAKEKEAIPMLAHTHKLVHFPAVNATETAEGNIEYWYCEGCDKYFSDEAGTKEITKDSVVIPKIIVTDPTIKVVKPDPVGETGEINGAPVKVVVTVTYPEAVTWTGGKITKDQLAALSDDGDIAKVDISGLKEAIQSIDTSVVPSNLIKVVYKISGKEVTSDGGSRAYFTVSVKLNNKAVKKAKIKGNDKKALKAIVAELNKKLSEKQYYFEIVPIKLADVEAKDITIKAALDKQKQLKKDENGNLTGIKSVKIKVKIKGVKKAKTYTFNTKKAAKQFVIKVTDEKEKKADITASDINTNFSGTSTGISVKK